VWIELLANLQWVCIIFFIGINLGYLVLIILSFLKLPDYVNQQILRELPKQQNDYAIPITMLIACYNEEGAIVTTVRSLLQVNYPEFEVLVVNDGSKDDSLKVMIEHFEMVEVPRSFPQTLPHAEIKAIYQSKKVPNLRMIDKVNGGAKADAMNAGIDASLYPLFCPFDGDTLVDKDCLTYLAQPFQEDPTTVAAGGVCRIVNGCRVTDGMLVEINAPRKLLALFQTLEYMRAYHYVRVGWESVNALPIISGAIGLFRKTALQDVGGYCRDTHADDFEIILKMHLHYTAANKPYRIAHSPKALCWTEVPESYEILKRQRVRWQKGFNECMWMNKKLTFLPKSGVMGWIGMPYQFIFEGFSPMFELLGYLITIICFFAGALSYEGAIAFLLMSLGSGFLVTFMTILIEELFFRAYPKKRDILILCLGAFIENFGYRQMNLLWRIEGFINWLRNKEGKREMPRLNTWQTP
jgi:cellulose synthase/poly-beta-1,6-N-acetylglucosamine synthase-like glycosyltransferase